MSYPSPSGCPSFLNTVQEGINVQLTIFYDGQYWVGVVEEAVGNRLKAYRHVFGAEPHNADVLKFAVTMAGLLLATVQPVVSAKLPLVRRISPKRLSRQAAKATQGCGVGTRAQQAIKAELKSRKQARKIVTRQEREDLVERKREIARQKAKARHRGH